jgi:hypothetical protein
MDPAPWWELFDVPTEEAIHDVLKTLLDMYLRWTGDTQWLREQTGSMQDRQTIWKTAAQLSLPISKEDVRWLLSQN